MGYLAYGAAAGVGKEYLEQSKETRKRDFTLIRDKRLKEMQGELIDQRQGLLAQREIDSDERKADAAEISASALKASGDADRSSQETMEANRLAAKGPETVNTAAGSATDYWDPETKSYKPIRDQPKTFSPTAGSAKLSQFMMESVEIRGAGGKSVGRQTRGELQDEWYRKAYEELDNPEFPGMGLKIKQRRPGSKGWVEYHNSMVTDQFKLAPDDPAHMQGDPDALLEHMSRNVPNFEALSAKAIERLKQDYPWWTGPQGSSKVNNPGTTGPNQGAPSNVPNPMNNEGPNADAETPPVNAGASVSKNPAASKQIGDIQAMIDGLKGKTGYLDETTRKALEQQLRALQQ